MSKKINISITGDGNTTTPKIEDHTKKTTIKISIGAIIIVGILAIIFSVSSGGIEKKIVGRWQMENSNEIYEFTNDGQFLYLTGSNHGLTVSYTIDGKRIYLNVDVLWASTTVSADLSVNNSTLVLSNFIDPEDIFGVDEGEELRFTKVD